MRMTFITEILLLFLGILIFYLLSALQYYLREDHLLQFFHQPLVKCLLEALGKLILVRNSPRKLSSMILQVFRRKRPPVFKSFMTQVSDKCKCLFLSFLFLIFNSLLWLKLNIFVKCDIMVTYRLICGIQTYRAFMTNVAVSAHYHLETRDYGEQTMVLPKIMKSSSRI